MPTGTRADIHFWVEVVCFVVNQPGAEEEKIVGGGNERLEKSSLLLCSFAVLTL